MPVLDDLAMRAIANALWPMLKLAKWRSHRQTRDLSDIGTRSTYKARAARVTPHPSRLLDHVVYYEESYMRTLLLSDEWPGGVACAVELQKDACEDALRKARMGSLASFHRVASLTKCRQPFVLAKNRHGTTVLRRNPRDPRLTTALLRSLLVIAGASEVRVVHPRSLEQAFGEQGGIHLGEVEAAIKCGGS